MSSKKALREINGFLQQFEELKKLAEQIEELGSIENVIAARQRELAEIDGRLAAKLHIAETDAQRHPDTAREMADATAANARDNAAAVIREAEARAIEMLQHAIGAAREGAEADVAAMKAEAATEAQRLVADAATD